MTDESSLVFVYNADSGLFNTLADIAHKAFSPQTYDCRLCALTYGLLQERGPWRDFIAHLPVECSFMHRDEFRRRYPKDKTPLPAVFRLRSGVTSVCLDARALSACEDLEQLQAAILAQCLAQDSSA